MTNSKKKGFKPLRRPLAPPSPPQPPPQLLPKSGKRSKYISGPSLRSQSLPSLVDGNDIDEDRVSPVPSNAPSLASDIADTLHNAPQNTPWTKRGASSQGHYQETISGSIDPSDWRFILESKYKIKWDKHGSKRTNPMESKSLVKPYKPRGPDAFPPRLPLKPPEVLKEFVYADADHLRYHDFPEFALEDFLIQNPLYGYSSSKLKTVIFSKQNYKKLTTLFAKFLETPVQEKENTVELKGEDIPEVQPRVPQHQILLEISNMIRQQMRSMVADDLLEQIPGMEGRGPSPVSGFMRPLPPVTRGTAVSGKENLFSAPPSKFFQGSVRSQEPFEDSNSAATISPSELAVLDCLVNGGLALSLKAHFIASLPEVSPLNRTITYLNLSFNDFRHLPHEVLSFRNLEILKLRNNPLKELPQDIHKLVKLKTLVLSFCLISTLPINLFQLSLEYLDMSYNKLSFLPNEVKQLKCLRFLNLEGNQLAALPCSFLKLSNLRSLRVYNNFMHPLFWRENSQNNPQRLTDLALLICKQEDIESKVQFSSELQRDLDSYTICECCHGPLYGPGLRIIRPCSRAFGVAHLPFFFTACSPQCRDSFMQNVESVSAIIYRDDGF
ncbi:uncharacterized protein [Apostichopus japonicus]|uniref:uncharacterized protein isoform X2 n=1 Tax=Stichopus japonicus TaxID=307972 RepID=UPI003AB2B2FE